ncbi:hypothetical protein [uncultured Microbulbifer sp.]|uniref:hypothetical protein n=1 Tax=uncultured Microbulbifer sp. TaxID=348147 RepID=UPI00262EBE09|nr:hypothetical protein [uncultured Microbulbifer sp.]
MNVVRMVAIVALFISGSIVAADQEVSVLKKEISLTGEQLVAFKLALDELKKRNLGTQNYKGTLYKFGENYVVIFEDPASPTGQRGSASKVRTFEVELSPNHEVVRASFSK